MKRCTKCWLWKPLGDFYRDARVRCGRKPSCKSCVVAATAAWQKRNAERHRQHQRRYRDRPDILELRADYARIGRLRKRVVNATVL
jgi:hypothetical protein